MAATPLLSLYSESLYDSIKYLGWFGLSNSYPRFEDELSMLTEGCWVNGQRNCTAMCNNASLIWGDSEDVNLNVSANLRNCINYLIISSIMEVETTDPHLWIENLDIAYGYDLKLSQVDISRINMSVSSCMNDTYPDYLYWESRWRSYNYLTVNVVYDESSAMSIQPTV